MSDALMEVKLQENLYFIADVHMVFVCSRPASTTANKANGVSMQVQLQV